MNYSDNEQRIYVDTGERVDVVGRGSDMQGTYVEIRHADGNVERTHPSCLRPLNWSELLADAVKRRQARLRAEAL